VTAVRLAMRLGRWGIVGFGAVAFVITLVNAAGFYQVAGHSAADRATFGRSMAILASEFSVILAPPIRPDTVGGYTEFRAYGALAILFAIWALASAAGATRGDEERGIVEVVLASGLSRAKAIGARIVAFVIGSFIAALAGSAGVIAGVASGRETIDVRATIAAAVVLTALAVSCYALTMLISQLTSARAATATAGAVLLALFLINSLGRTLDWLSAWRWLSPFHYWELSRPLSPAGAVDIKATLVLVAIALVAGVLATAAFALRDLGSPLISPPAPSRPATYDPSMAAVWRIPVARDLWERRVGLGAWTAGMAALAALLVVVTKAIVGPLLAVPQLRIYFSLFLHGALYPSFLGFVWLGVAQLLLAAYAITQVARWSTEDSDGRLELILSTPFSRTLVVLERAIVLSIGVLVIATVSGVAVGLQSHNQSIDLDVTSLVRATVLLVPFTMVFAAVGSVLVARIPRATAGLLGAFILASYLLTELGPIFKLPTWVQDLSAFKLYGRPLTEGIDGTGLAIMLLIVIAGFGASAALMQRRDVSR
jgi:ABC-2 type transport system permease protein